MSQEHISDNPTPDLLTIADALIVLTRRVETLGILTEATTQVELIHELHKDDLSLHNTPEDPMLIAFNAAVAVAKTEIRKSKPRRDPFKVIKVLESFLSSETTETNLQ